MTLTGKIAKFCVEISNSRLPLPVQERTKACIADALHAALLAHSSQTGALLRQYLNMHAAPGKSSAIGSGRTTPESAALYNASLAAVHEIDDVHYDTSMHPGAVLVPAALSACQAGDAPSSRLLCATAVGYEVAIRLSIAAGYRHYHFFHAAATCGAVGAAAAASVALGLTEQQTQNALGLAATSASGLWEGITDQATMVKHLHLGQAAERGIRSAQLAALGWPGAPEALEGQKGFLSALAQPGDHAPAENPGPEELAHIITGGLGETWAITRNIFKRTPFCLGVSEPLEGMRELLRLYSNRRHEIQQVLVETSPSVAWMVGNPAPQDEAQARFSAPYALALLLAGLDPETIPLPVRWLEHPDVKNWMPKIKMIGNPEIGSRRAVVTAVFQNGERRSADQPLRNLSEQEVFDRFLQVAQRVLGDAGSQLSDMVSNLEHNVSLHKLGSILAHPTVNDDLKL